MTGRRAARGGVWASALAIAAVAPAGCSSSPGRIERENDRLREQVLDLETEVNRLQGRARELEAQLQAASTVPGSVPEEVRANTPTVTAIAIDRRSHVQDSGEDGTPGTLVVYVKPSDGLGRFVQMVGDLSVHAAILPADGDAVTIGRVALGPAALREAYRSSFMGTHYTIEVPLAIPAPVPGETRALVVVEFVDGLTGTHHTAEHGVDLR